MTKAILCFCCPGTGQQKRQSSNYSPVATYGSRKNAAGAYAAAAWVKKRLIFVGIIFIYFQVGLNSNGMILSPVSLIKGLAMPAFIRYSGLERLFVFSWINFLV